MRILAAITIQPHLAKGKKVTPEKLLSLPWDKDSKKAGKKVTSELTAEQHRKRFEELVNKLGDKI